VTSKTVTKVQVVTRRENTAYFMSWAKIHFYIKK